MSSSLNPFSSRLLRKLLTISPACRFNYSLTQFMLRPRTALPLGLIPTHIRLRRVMCVRFLDSLFPPQISAKAVNFTVLRSSPRTIKNSALISFSNFIRKNYLKANYESGLGLWRNKVFNHFFFRCSFSFGTNRLDSRWQRAKARQRMKKG